MNIHRHVNWRKLTEFPLTRHFSSQEKRIVCCHDKHWATLLAGHCGSEQPHVPAIIIHFPMISGVNEWVSDWANKWAQRRAQAKQVVRSKRFNERCKQMSKCTSEWPSTSSVLLIALNHRAKENRIVCYHEKHWTTLLARPSRWRGSSMGVLKAEAGIFVGLKRFVYWAKGYVFRGKGRVHGVNGCV